MRSDATALPTLPFSLQSGSRQSLVPAATIPLNGGDMNSRRTLLRVADRHRGVSASRIACWVLACVLVISPGACARTGSELEVVGAVESVALVGEDVSLDARIDTGATLCSLDAHSISAFEKEGARWVRFAVHAPDGARAIEVERPILRSVEVKRHGEPDAERHCVTLRLRLGATSTEVEVTLADRSNYEYPLLVGRDLLAGRYMVDVSRERIAGTSGL